MIETFWEERPGPIIEQTSASSTHYELTAISSPLQASHDVSQIAITQAQDALQAHHDAAASYQQQLDVPDFQPFASMPAGTEVRDLPSGERLFVLADGAFLETTTAGHFIYIDANGEVHNLLEVDGRVQAPDGRVFVLLARARATYNLEWISGLPAGVAPTLVAEDRYSMTLPNGVRLDVSFDSKAANPLLPSPMIWSSTFSPMPKISGLPTTTVVPAGLMITAWRSSTSPSSS